MDIFNVKRDRLFFLFLCLFGISSTALWISISYITKEGAAAIAFLGFTNNQFVGASILGLMLTAWGLVRVMSLSD